MAIFEDTNGWSPNHIIRCIKSKTSKKIWSLLQVSEIDRNEIDLCLTFLSYSYFRPIISSNCEKGQVSEAAKDKTVSEWLWKVSEKWTGLDGSGGKKI